METNAAALSAGRILKPHSKAIRVCVLYVHLLGKSIREHCHRVQSIPRGLRVITGHLEPVLLMLKKLVSKLICPK